MISNLKTGLLIGATIMVVVSVIGVALMNASIGPSYNTVDYCYELKRDGYLADECFDKYGFLIKRGCKGPTQTIQR